MIKQRLAVLEPEGLDGLDDLPERVSSRQAERLLARVGVTRRMAQKVLASGLAGPPVRTERAVLYPSQQVVELLHRHSLRHDETLRRVPQGVLVLRRFVDLAAAPEDRREMVARDWDLGVFLPLLLPLYRQKDKQGDQPFAVVVTIAGFVAAGYDLAGTRRQADGRVSLALTDPGDWFAEVRDTHIDSGPGSPWHLWHQRDSQSARQNARKNARQNARRFY